MSREGISPAPSSHTQASAAAASTTDAVHGNEANTTVVEDSNNNTSLIDREQPAEGTPADSNNSPSIREIHKNSWLKRMPCVDRWSGRFPKTQKPEKFWVVFCVHDDKEAYLEFYENRRSAYSHMPLTNISLSKCLHISPTIVAQENDHEFVITLETQVIRLAASTNEQMLEWMDTMRTKLRELGVLEPKDNLYSKEPMPATRSAMLGNIDLPGRSAQPSDILGAAILSNQRSSMSEHSSDHPVREEFNRLSMRDPNSPLPPVPGSIQSTSDTSQTSTAPSSTIVYIRNPPILRASNHGSSSSITSSPTASSESAVEASPHSVPSSIFNFENVVVDSLFHERVSRSNSIVSQESASPVSSPTSVEQRISSVPSTPLADQMIYEPLFCSSSPSISVGIRNPNYENPPNPQLRAASNQIPALPPRPASDQRRMSTSVASDIQFVHSVVRTSGLSNFAATSDPSLNVSSQDDISISESTAQAGTPFSPAVLQRSHSHLNSSHVSDRSNALPLDEGPPPYNNSGPPIRNLQGNSSINNGTMPVDENGKPLSLREVQVQKLQAEIFHKSGVRLVLRKKDCINSIALVECFSYVWVAGWKQKEHPFLHNTFHVGDRIISIAGHRILSVQDAHKAIKHQSSIVEFVVRRVPCGRVLAIKREYEGQDLGIIREGGTAEIKEIKSNGLAARHGLAAKAPTLDGRSLCNWFLTEINHRPLNLFFKDNEVHDRLNAVGLDISILVQPIDLVKALKKQLKALRSYKDYIVQ